MEQVGQTASVARALLRHVSKGALKQGVWQTVFMDTQMPLPAGIGAGFVPVPHQVLPKTQVLVGQSFGGSVATEIQGRPWRVQQGDWDAF